MLLKATESQKFSDSQLSPPVFTELLLQATGSGGHPGEEVAEKEITIVLRNTKIISPMVVGKTDSSVDPDVSDDGEQEVPRVVLGEKGPRRYCHEQMLAVFDACANARPTPTGMFICPTGKVPTATLARCLL